MFDRYFKRTPSGQVRLFGMVLSSCGGACPFFFRNCQLVNAASCVGLEIYPKHNDGQGAHLNLESTPGGELCVPYQHPSHASYHSRELKSETSNTVKHCSTPYVAHLADLWVT